MSNPVLDAIENARDAIGRGEIASVIIDTDNLAPMDEDEAAFTADWFRRLEEDD